MAELNVVELIVAKRDGGKLEPSQIRALISEYTNGSVPDYQMSAFLMAAFFRGLDETETFALTESMLESGIIVDLSGVPGTKVDKHSTGGVGDKISLILAPVVASCGVPVPMISGRGLGFTGGTLDKLESITGFRTSMSTDEYRRQVAEIGVVMIGQTDEIAPADRALYALRDVTGTVEFIPFIASSIMSKKLAEGIDALVLDVKCGRGAFMKEEPLARRLAETLVEIGDRFGKRTVAWMTRMDEPIGRAVGNWPEVVESLSCLRGEDVPDVTELVVTLSGEMIHLGGKAESAAEGAEKAAAALKSGQAYEKFLEIVRVQGGDVSLLHDPAVREGYEPAAVVKAVRSGFIAGIDALEVARTATAMGAGRLRKEDKVDPLAGITLQKKGGYAIRAGETLAHLFTTRTDELARFEAAVRGAFLVTDEPPVRSETVLLDRFEAGAWSGDAR